MSVAWNTDQAPCCVEDGAWTADQPL